ncbi:deaminase [Thioclava sp. GXIMD4215]|uniref:deaminase n=1 Tax=Thioclava sp. GXIMD4215 TaxID=3131928 RepID=UPI0038738090
MGCVTVRGEQAVAGAVPMPAAATHAERQAVVLAGPRAKGATLYVTLEPCCHWGVTPPCTDAIIASGISRGVCALRDPDRGSMRCCARRGGRCGSSPRGRGCAAGAAP